LLGQGPFHRSDAHNKTEAFEAFEHPHDAGEIVLATHEDGRAGSDAGEGDVCAGNEVHERQYDSPLSHCQGSRCRFFTPPLFWYSDPVDTEDFQPWRRDALAPELPDDDDAAWSAFQVWLVQERHFGRLAKMRRVPLETIERWARLGHWRARGRAYDAWLEEVRDEAIEATTRNLVRGFGLAADVAFRELGMYRRAQETIDRHGTLSPQATIRYLREATLGLQLLQGKPTERIETVGAPLEKASDEELEALARAAEIQERLKRAG
jgi:hypothetical protein